MQGLDQNGSLPFVFTLKKKKRKKVHLSGIATIVSIGFRWNWKVISWKGNIYK